MYQIVLNSKPASRIYRTLMVFGWSILSKIRSGATTLKAFAISAWFQPLLSSAFKTCKKILLDFFIKACPDYFGRKRTKRNQLWRFQWPFPKPPTPNTPSLYPGNDITITRISLRRGQWPIPFLPWVPLPPCFLAPLLDLSKGTNL